MQYSRTATTTCVHTDVHIIMETTRKCRRCHNVCMWFQPVPTSLGSDYVVQSCVEKYVFLLFFENRRNIPTRVTDNVYGL